MSEFNAPIQDMKQIYISFIRSILEQSCTVWNTSLTDKNIQDIERIQKSAVKIILKQNKISYQKSLSILELDTLQERRNFLCLNFARKCIKNGTMNDLFTQNKKNKEGVNRNVK